jgi:hypothetical protein
VSDHEIFDPVAVIVSGLLGCVDDRLGFYDVPVCRSFWHPGADAPWDACGTTEGGAEGQAWVAVQRVYAADSFPTENAAGQRCVPYGYAADLRVGILRCAATVDGNGRAPSPEQVTVDAVKVSRDRQIALEAITCCFVTEDDDPGIFLLRGWTPLGPQGGCVGGAWDLTVAVPPCPCPPMTGFGLDPFGTSPFGGA